MTAHQTIEEAFLIASICPDSNIADIKNSCGTANTATHAVICITLISINFLMRI